MYFLLFKVVILHRVQIVYPQELCVRVFMCVRVCLLCLLTSPLELPCHAGLVKVGIGAPVRETGRSRNGALLRTTPRRFNRSEHAGLCHRHGREGESGEGTQVEAEVEARISPVNYQRRGANHCIPDLSSTGKTHVLVWPQARQLALNKWTKVKVWCFSIRGKSVNVMTF